MLGRPVLGIGVAEVQPVQPQGVVLVVELHLLAVGFLQQRAVVDVAPVHGPAHLDVVARAEDVRVPERIDDPRHGQPRLRVGDAQRQVAEVLSLQRGQIFRRVRGLLGEVFHSLA